MNEPIFDPEKLDVYRLAIDYVGGLGVGRKRAATLQN